MLVLVAGGAVGVFHTAALVAAAGLPVDAGIGVDVDDGHLIVAVAGAGEIAGHVAAGAVPSVVDVVEQQADAAVAVGAVAVIAEGGVHQIVHPVELIGGLLGVIRVDGVQGIVVGHVLGGCPDIAVRAFSQDLEGQAGAAAGVVAGNREALGVADIIGCRRTTRLRFFDITVIGVLFTVFIVDHAVYVDNVHAGAVVPRPGDARIGAGADAGLNEARHGAGGIGGGGGRCGIVDHHVVALIAACGVVVDHKIVVNRANLIRVPCFCRQLHGEHGKHHTEHEEN